MREQRLASYFGVECFDKNAIASCSAYYAGPQFRLTAYSDRQRGERNATMRTHRVDVLAHVWVLGGISAVRYHTRGNSRQRTLPWSSR